MLYEKWGMDWRTNLSCEYSINLAGELLSVSVQWQMTFQLFRERLKLRIRDLELPIQNKD